MLAAAITSTNVTAAYYCYYYYFCFCYYNMINPPPPAVWPHISSPLSTSFKFPDVKSKGHADFVGRSLAGWNKLRPGAFSLPPGTQEVLRNVSSLCCVPLRIEQLSIQTGLISPCSAFTTRKHLWWDILHHRNWQTLKSRIWFLVLFIVLSSDVMEKMLIK